MNEKLISQNEESEETISTQSNDIFIYFCFLNLGINGLFLYNCILTMLSFFEEYQKDYKPSFYYIYFNFILNLSSQFYLTLCGHKHSYKTLTYLSCFLTLFVVISLPLATIYLSPSVGFIVNALSITIQGLASGIILSASYGFAAIYGLKYLIAVSTGNGISGIMGNLIQYFVLVVFNYEDKKLELTISAFVFFGIVLVYSLLSFALFVKMFNLPEITAKLDDIFGEHVVRTDEGWAMLKRIVTSIPDWSFLMFIHFAISFIGFPGLFLMQPF